jgi:tetratricopeptide (TPR) repeat protein
MFRIKVAFALIVLAASIASAKVMAQDTSNHSIGTHRIYRFEAIQLLHESLKSNPNDAAAWIVLGELAHEVAQDLSSQDDESYYKLSLEAYEKALALQPKNAGLKAAIELRKSELAASGFNTTVQTDSPPTPPTPPTPPAAVAATNSAPVSQPTQTYQYPVSQPYYVEGAQPYTYQQYAGSYLYTSPVSNTYGTVPGVTSGAHRRRSER